MASADQVYGDLMAYQEMEPVYASVAAMRDVLLGADVHDGGQRCGRGSCKRREQEKDQFMVCGGCEVIAYCSPNCQTLDWSSTHRKHCKILKQERDKGTSSVDLKKKYMRLQDSGIELKVPMASYHERMVHPKMGRVSAPSLHRLLLVHAVNGMVVVDAVRGGEGRIPGRWLCARSHRHTL